MSKITRIQGVSPESDLNTANDNADVHVYLEDGRVFSFVVGTPSNIYGCMDNEGIDHFFGIPFVFVREMTMAQIQKAMHAIFTEGKGKWVSVYGALQQSFIEDE